MLISASRSEDVRSRRQFLRKSAFGFGSMALSHLLGRDGGASAAETASKREHPLGVKEPHFSSKAKSVIFIFLQGGLSQVDSFDPKPALAQWEGKLLPADFGDGKLLLAQINASEAQFMQSRRTFKKRGQSGIEISDLFEHTAEMADDLALIRSCYHESFIHGPALSMLNTGSLRLGAPSLGAWSLYGLGSETDSLPAYVVMTDNCLESNSTGEPSPPSWGTLDWTATLWRFETRRGSGRIRWIGDRLSNRDPAVPNPHHRPRPATNGTQETKQTQFPITGPHRPRIAPLLNR